MAISINFVSIVLNSQNRNATISIGENSQAGWSTHNKNNYGNGFYAGNTVSPNNIINILDNDVVDMPVNDSDVVPSGQNQSL